MSYHNKPKVFGLQIRKKKDEKKWAQRKTGLGVFSGFSVQDSDDEPDADPTVLNTATRQRISRMKQKKAERAYKKNMAEDSTIYQYDEIYDDMQKSRLSHLRKTDKEKRKRKSKYIGKIQAHAVIRNKINEAARENMKTKERQKMDHIYEGKKKFITSAYKKKLDEDKRIKELIDKKEEMDAKNRNDGAFYSYLYKQLTNKDQVNAEDLSSSSDESSSDSEQERGYEPSSSRKKGRHNTSKKKKHKKRKKDNRDSSSEEDEKRKKKNRKSKKKKRKRKRSSSSSDEDSSTDSETSKNRLENQRQRKRKKYSQNEIKKRLKTTQSTKSNVSDAKARFLARKNAKQSD